MTAVNLIKSYKNDDIDFLTLITELKALPPQTRVQEGDDVWYEGEHDNTNVAVQGLVLDGTITDTELDTIFTAWYEL